MWNQISVSVASSVPSMALVMSTLPASKSQTHLDSERGMGIRKKKTCQLKPGFGAKVSQKKLGRFKGLVFVIFISGNREKDIGFLTVARYQWGANLISLDVGVTRCSSSWALGLFPLFTILTLGKESICHFHSNCSIIPNYVWFPLRKWKSSDSTVTALILWLLSHPTHAYRILQMIRDKRSKTGASYIIKLEVNRF